MHDADLADRLVAETRPRTVTALPDGSVDSYYEVYGDRGERIGSATDFGERVSAGGNVSVRVSRTARTPGGQAVNAARQAHALGDDVTLFGHLDDPVFADLDFETRSMGDPTAVQVLDFPDEEVLLADSSADLAGWRLEDLESVADDPEQALTPDAVCCGNWVSVEGMSEVLRTLGARSLDGGWFVLDPGDVAAAEPGRARNLVGALEVLSDAYDVVVSANRSELSAIVRYGDEDVRTGENGGDADDSESATSDDGSATGSAESPTSDSESATGDAESHTSDAESATSDSEIVTAVRERTSASAVVMHEKDVAVAATPDGAKRVPNYEVRDSKRPTGAGDCFTAALAHALVRGWDWRTALELGNLSAAYRVETGETGDRASLRAFLRDHDTKT